MRCEICGREVVLPFRCSFCGKNFCIEHRHPENHQCPDMPQDSLYWLDRRRVVSTKDEIGKCPKCGRVNEIKDYDAKTMTFECRGCEYKYVQLKAFPHNYIPYENYKKRKEN